MGTWYRTRWHNSTMAEVESVKILKSTSSSVWEGQHRRAKHTSYEDYFETRAEAVAYILEGQRERVARYIEQIKQHKAIIAKFSDASQGDAI